MGSQSNECEQLIDKIAKTMAYLHSNEFLWSQQTVDDSKSWWSQVAQLAMKSDTFTNRFWLRSLWIENQSNIKERFRNFLSPSLSLCGKGIEQKAILQSHGSLSTKSRKRLSSDKNNNYLLKQDVSTFTKSNVYPLSCGNNNSNTMCYKLSNSNNNNSDNLNSSMFIPSTYFQSSGIYRAHHIAPLKSPLNENTNYSHNPTQQPDSFGLNLESKEGSLMTYGTNDSSSSPLKSLWLYEEDKENEQETQFTFPESPLKLVNSNQLSPAKSSSSSFAHEDDFLVYPGSQFADEMVSSPTKILATGSEKSEETIQEHVDAESSLLLSLSPSISHTKIGSEESSPVENVDPIPLSPSKSSAPSSKTTTVPIPVLDKFWSIDAKNLLESEDLTKLSTKADFKRITEHTVFLFDTTGAADAYWLNDGEDWLIGKAQAQPWRKGKAFIQARTYILRRNGLKLPIRKCEYWCLRGETDNWNTWETQRVVIQYTGNFRAFHFPKSSTYLKSASLAETEAEKNGPIYTGIPQPPTRTPKSTFLRMDKEIESGCRGKKLYSKLSKESNRLKIQGKPDLKEKNTKQIYNRERQLKRKKPVFRDDIGDISAMAEEFPEIFPKIEIGFRKIIIMSHPELHKHLNEFHKLAKAYIFSYDTTFNLGPFFVSVLSVRHPALNENPAIPVSIMFHTYQDSDDTHVSMFKTTKMSLTCFDHSKNLLITDREKGITKAISNELTKLHNSYCFNHIRQNLLHWTTKHYRHNKVLARVLQLDVKKLLWAKSEKEYENYISSRCDSDDCDPCNSEDEEDEIEVELEEGTKMDIGHEEEQELQNHVAPWDSKFKGYFYKYLDSDIRQSFRGRLKKYSIFNLNSGCTNNAGESLNDVIKNHMFEAGEEKTLYTIANYIHDWQSLILLDIDKALKGESSNYTVKQDFQGRLASLTEIKVPDSTLIFRDDLREPTLPPKLQKVESDVNWSIKEKIARNLVDKGKVQMMERGFFSVQGQRKQYLVHLANKTCTCNNTRCYHRIAVGIAVGTYNHPSFEYLKQIKATTTTDTYKNSVPKRSGKKGSNVIRVPIQLEEGESSGEDVETDESSMSISSTVSPSFECTSSENEEDDFSSKHIKKSKSSNKNPTKNISTRHQPHSKWSRGQNGQFTSTGSRGAQGSSSRGRGGQGSSSRGRGAQVSSSRGRGAQVSSSRGRGAQVSSSRGRRPKSTSLLVPRNQSTSLQQPQPTPSGQKSSLPSTETNNSVLLSSKTSKCTTTNSECQQSTTPTSKGHNSLTVSFKCQSPPSPSSEGPMPSSVSSPGQKSTTISSIQQPTTSRSRRGQSCSAAVEIIPPVQKKSNKQLVHQNMKLPIITAANGHDPLITISNHHLSLRELKTLTGLTKEERQSLVENPDHYQNLISNENWLTDGIIFTYLQQTKAKETMVLSPEQSTFIFTNKRSCVKSRMFNDTSGVRYGQWESSRLALVPFNVDKNHWVLLVARFREETVWILDPLSNWKPSVFEEIALENCLHKALGKVEESEREVWSFVQKECAKQKNYDDCGVYILHLAGVVQKGGSLMSHPKGNFRLQILDELLGNCQLSHKLENGVQKVCTKCKTSKTSKSPTAWLKCSRCSLWTHKSCDLKFNPKTMSELVYIC